MTRLDELNEKYPVRKSNIQKRAFSEFVISEAEKCGFTARIEKTADGKNENIVIGDPVSAKTVFTAHFDTPAASLFPNIMIPRNKLVFWLYQFAPIVFILALALTGGYLLGMVALGSYRAFLGIFLVIYYVVYFLAFRAFENKHNFNDNTSGVATVMSIIDGIDESEMKTVAFILFDNEEKGKKGSKAYFKDHKSEMQGKLVINFDCVGNGENIIFIAMKDAENKAEYSALKESFVSSENFETNFYPIKGSESNSDYKNFPCGVGCMASKRAKSGLLYTPRIHTRYDTVAKNENVEYITDGIRRFIKNINA